MKKLFLPLCICFALSLCICSCAQKSNTEETYLASIAALESQLAELRANQEQADRESQKRLEELSGLLSSSDEETDTDTSENTEPEAPQATGFKYTLSNGNATVTGYVGTEQNIVIPASIDGYRVVAIGESAFADSDIKSVIVSDGITSIGWFAFDGCVRLKSITLPSSVTEIGYSALGSTESGSTVYCHESSFALEYAKSYGLSYAII